MITPYGWYNIAESPTIANFPLLFSDNCKQIIQFGSSDDPFLPWSEQKTVAEETKAVFHASDSHGHYMNSTFPELLKAVKGLLN